MQERASKMTNAAEYSKQRRIKKGLQKTLFLVGHTNREEYM
jgi:hypothetical protein